MVRPQTIFYADVDDSSTDDEIFENCRLTMEPTWNKVPKANVSRSSRNNQTNSSWNVCHRQMRYTDDRQPLLVLDPAALQEDARFMTFTGSLNIDNSDVHLGPNVTTINNTTYEPVIEGNNI